MKEIMKFFVKTAAWILLNFLIYYQFIGKMGAKEYINYIGKILNVGYSTIQTMQFLHK